MQPEDSEPTRDAFWAKLAVRLPHPVQVQVIEAFRYTGQPLTTRDLSEIVGGVEPVHLDYHLGRLRTVGVLDCGLVHPGTGFMDVRYQLIGARDRRGRC